MHRLHQKLFLAIIVVLVLFTVVAATMWHSASVRARFLMHGAHVVLILGSIAAALALLAYPIARGITARLGRLDEGVRKFGAGDLAVRVAVEGTDEVANLAASFNESAARIEQLVKTNQMLLANCSHELRTPLTRMRLAVDRLRTGDTQAGAELSRNIGELDGLIGELLLSSRLDATRRPDRIERIDLLALAAEEAAHFIRHLSAGDEFPRTPLDAFYANVLHEAIGFFGSKIINPKRKCMRTKDFKSLIDYFKRARVPRDRTFELEIAHAVLEVKKLEKRGKPIADPREMIRHQDLFFGVTHALGYMLGEILYHAMVLGKLKKKEIVRIIADPFSKERETWEVYRGLLGRFGDIGLPQRM